MGVAVVVNRNVATEVAVLSRRWLIGVVVVATDQVGD